MEEVQIEKLKFQIKHQSTNIEYSLFWSLSNDLSLSFIIHFSLSSVCPRGEVDL